MHKNGDKYSGEFKDGKKNGFGTYVYHKTQDVYIGEFFNNKKNRHGKYTWENGDVYIGQYSNGVRDGRGEYICDGGNNAVFGEERNSGKSGYRYIGEFRENMKHGFGKQYLISNTQNREREYIGRFSRDKRHGVGTLVFDNKTCWLGRFENGLPAGPGEFTYTNGSKHVGPLDVCRLDDDGQSADATKVQKESGKDDSINKSAEAI